MHWFRRISPVPTKTATVSERCDLLTFFFNRIILNIFDTKCAQLVVDLSSRCIEIHISKTTKFYLFSAYRLRRALALWTLAQVWEITVMWNLLHNNALLLGPFCNVYLISKLKGSFAWPTFSVVDKVRLGYLCWSLISLIWITWFQHFPQGRASQYPPVALLSIPSNIDIRKLIISITYGQ